MIVNETLASGLKNRFIVEVEDQSKEFKRSIKDNEFQLKLKSSWDDFSRHLNRCASGGKLCDYEGGGNKRRYRTLSLIYSAKDRPLNSWNESCISGLDVFFTLNPVNIETVYAPYAVGEHAIARMFMRLKGIGDDWSKNRSIILNQLEQIPLWSNFWLKTFYRSLRLKEHEKCFPVIPAPDGLFLCEFDLIHYFIEVRTFIGDSQLTEEQAAIKRMLLDIGVTFVNSPASFSVDLAAITSEPGWLMQMGVSKFLSEHKHFEILMRAVFSKFDDDKRRMEVRGNVGKEIKIYGDSYSDDMHKMYERMGARKFMIYARNALQKKPV
jgi:hypothetical protein